MRNTVQMGYDQFCMSSVDFFGPPKSKSESCLTVDDAIEWLLAERGEGLSGDASLILSLTGSGIEDSNLTELSRISDTHVEVRSSIFKRQPMPAKKGIQLTPEQRKAVIDYLFDGIGKGIFEDRSDLWEPIDDEESFSAYRIAVGEFVDEMKREALFIESTSGWCNLFKPDEPDEQSKEADSAQGKQAS
jgi:hypothetical protein